MLMMLFLILDIVNYFIFLMLTIRHTKVTF